MKRKLCALLLLTFVLFTLALPVYATVDGTDAAGGTTKAVTQEVEPDTSDDSNLIGMKAIACGIAISVAAGGGAVGMGIATGKAVEGLSRQPEVEGKIRTNFMLGIVFMETAIIYALLVIILIIFVI
ncbi:MAG: ATP synthase F0 subunit C [Firmicutes bacterium]|nr:ATP synthase F0 subunit C [Bacillota bacterium]